MVAGRSLHKSRRRPGEGARSRSASFRERLCLSRRRPACPAARRERERRARSRYARVAGEPTAPAGPRHARAVRAAASSPVKRRRISMRRRRSRPERRRPPAGFARSRRRAVEAVAAFGWCSAPISKISHNLVHCQPGRGVRAPSRVNKRVHVRDTSLAGLAAPRCRLPSVKGEGGPRAARGPRPAVGSTSPAWMPRRLPSQPKQV